MAWQDLPNVSKVDQGSDGGIMHKFIFEKPKKKKKAVVRLGRNFLLVDRQLLQNQHLGKPFKFYHYPSLSTVDLRKIDRDDMHVDSLDEKYHACLEDISCPTFNEENNLTLNEKDNLVEELLENSSMDLNDMASGESLVTSPQLFEAATLQEIHTSKLRL
ncbi:hypothetical protein RHMOL_Rhmol13G0171200 [Rhododendron molle]|uniref:Uncharacterized protein n=1 Tax=Rhododendron molle TaxID=49168 RepID=A0ACC0L8M1_RHOML|nr:hypothetical protein RHMOL_Rhmol13G0171200 [Rhododendron molle]